MSNNKIKTYNISSFQSEFISEREEFNRLLRPESPGFFIVRLEDIFPLINFPLPPSRSTLHTLIYVVDGELTMSVSNDVHSIRNNECLIIPAGQVFSYEQQERNIGFICGFDNDFYKKTPQSTGRYYEFLRIWGNPRISPDHETSAFLRVLLMRLLHHYTESWPACADILQCCFDALLSEVNHVYRPVADGRHTQALTITNQFKELLSANIKSLHRVTDYASLINVSPNHLNKSVKSVTGKSPTKWIDEAIVLEAKVLLYQSDMSVAEIAAEIGLADPSYFSRMFRREEGMTPSAFRKTIRKKA